MYTVNLVGGSYTPLVQGCSRRLYLGTEIHLDAPTQIDLLAESLTLPYPTDINRLSMNYAAHDHPDAANRMQRPATVLFHLHDGVAPLMDPIFLPANDVSHHTRQILLPRLQRITTLYWTVQAHGLGGRFEVQIVGMG